MRKTQPKQIQQNVKLSDKLYTNPCGKKRVYLEIIYPCLLFNKTYDLWPNDLDSIQ